MTNEQWKRDLRRQIEDWEILQKLIEAGNTSEALEKIGLVKARIREGLEN